MIHIVFKINKEDLFSNGKTYEGNVCEAYQQWEKEFPSATFMGLYLHCRN